MPHVSGITASNKPLLTFRAKDNTTPAAALRYECSQDGGPYQACRSGVRWSMVPGDHALRVRALDRTGNRSRPRPVAVRVTPTPSFAKVAFDSQFEPGNIVAGGGAIWLGGSNGIHRIDPATRSMRLLAAGQDLYDLAYGHGSVWTTTFGIFESSSLRWLACSWTRASTRALPSFSWNSNASASAHRCSKEWKPPGVIALPGVPRPEKLGIVAVTDRHAPSRPHTSPVPRGP